MLTDEYAPFSIERTGLGPSGTAVGAADAPGSAVGLIGVSALMWYDTVEAVPSPILEVFEPVLKVDAAFTV